MSTDPSPDSSDNRTAFPPVIILTGMPASGKGELAEIALHRGCRVKRMGDFIWDEVELRGLEKTPEHVGRVANEMRETHGPDIWAERTLDWVGRVVSRIECDAINGRSICIDSRFNGKKDVNDSPLNDVIKSGFNDVGKRRNNDAGKTKNDAVNRVLNGILQDSPEVSRVGQSKNDVSNYHVKRYGNNSRDNALNFPPGIIIDGSRSLAEYDRFRAALGDSLKVVAVHASPKTRFQRMSARGRSDDSDQWGVFDARDRRELSWGIGDLIALADAMIVNEGGLEALQAAIGKLLDEWL